MAEKITNDSKTEIIYLYTDELMDEWAFTASAVVLFLIGFFGFFLNLFVIILMCKDMQLWTPMNIILFNLVCADFSVSILGNPFTLASAIAHEWIFGKTLCICYGFFMSLLGITSITTLTVLSYERYRLVSCPFSAQYLSKGHAGLLVIFIWVYSISLTVLPLFGWGEYASEAANISCSVNWETQTLNARSYIVFLFIMGMVLPATVIFYSYINIIRTLRQTSVRLRRMNPAEKRVTWMIAVMIIAFHFAWSFYAIFALVEQFGPSDYISPGMAIIPALIAKSSICYNPLIYVGMNTQYRAALKRMRGIDLSNVENSDGSDKMTVECTTFINLKKSSAVIKMGGLSNKTSESDMSVINTRKCLLIKASHFKNNISNK